MHNKHLHDGSTYACQLVIMPHNLMIVDYALGQPGSIHDSYAFQGTWIAQDPTSTIPQSHWIWAGIAYPLEKWCVVLFKKPKGGNLTRQQNTYNRYVSKVCTKVNILLLWMQNSGQIHVCVKHAIAALKGRFQSLWELRLQMQSKEDLHIAVYWIKCCFILHNMIIVFEENHWRQGEQVGSLRWAREEAVVYGDEPEPDVGLEQPRGTEGQQFRGHLIEKLSDQHAIQF